MKLFNKYNVSLLLMLGSLILLFLFQGAWLRSSYQQEVRTLRKQADLVFIDAVREIEDSILKIAIMDPIDFFCNDSTTFDDVRIAFGLNMDSVNNIVNNTTKKAGFEMDVRTDIETHRKDQRFGSLSFFMATTETSDLFSHPFLEDCGPDNPTKDLLESQLKKMLPCKYSDVPDTYQLAVIRDGESRAPGFYSNIQTDILRGDSYALYFPYFRGFILKKMMPQILFSVLLFGVIFLSFWLTWRNLKEQRRLTALKNDFISNVTHELKTPITTVGVAIEALSSFDAIKNPERTKEYLEISKYELNRLTILVDKVLKMSLFEKKEPELKIETFDLKALVNEVLSSMRLQFEKFAAKVDLKTDGNAFYVEGDRIHLTSVIYNLIDNALKYSPEQPEINLTLESSDAELRFSIQDKGIGIPSDYLDKIFEKFFRVPSGDQHDIKGHGLGLSYVASVISKHKGKINVDSRQNIGTQFTISLPKQHG